MASFVQKNKDFVLKLRLVGAGTPQIRRVRLPRVAVDGTVSFDTLVEVAIQYTFPAAPMNVDDYKVVFTYYDVDNDCVTIASTEELVDAIEQFSAVNEKVLRITTDVKRKKSPNSFATPPRTPSRGSSPVRRSPPPQASPQSKTHAQLQNVLEAFASVLAAAVVAIQGQISPVAPVLTPAAVAQEEGSTPECAIDLTEEGQESEQVKEEVPKEQQERKRPFVHGRHTCDGCLITPIVGTRFHATNLPDYDLCAKCRNNYKGDYIQFEEAELDRDRPFQERWHRKRHIHGLGRCAGRRARHGRGAGGPCGPRGRHMHGPRLHQATNDCKRDEMALKEALRRSLLDMDAMRKERAAKDEEKVTVKEEEKMASTPIEEYLSSACVDETKPVAAPAAEAPKTKDESFSSDAAGNGDVAEVLGATLDQCAEAIDAMMDELDRKSDTGEPEIVDKNEKSELFTAVYCPRQQRWTLPDEATNEENVELDRKSDTGEPKNVVKNEENERSSASVVSEDVVGATIIEATNVVNDGIDGDESINSEKSEDDWSVVDEDKPQVVEDEMIALAAEAIGSALYQSDLSANLETSLLSATSTVPSSVPSISSDAPVADVVLARWAPQLTQLRELGFFDDRMSLEVLERLAAANIGVESTDEITVTQVVNEMLKQK